MTGQNYFRSGWDWSEFSSFDEWDWLKFIQECLGSVRNCLRVVRDWSEVFW